MPVYTLGSVFSCIIVTESVTTVCGFVTCNESHCLEKGWYKNYFISCSNNKDQNGFSNKGKYF